MAENRVTIDPTTVFDNVDERQIEFSGTANEESYRFALRYDVLEALAGETPTDPVPLFQHHAARIELLAATALARDPDQDIVIVSENDLA